MVDGRVPVGAGLSSSAALECAVAAAASDLMALDLMDDDGVREALAAICVNAENTIAGAPTGGMDQSAALRSQPGHALLLDCRDGSISQVPFDLGAHGLSLLVMDTRAEHALVDGQYAQRRTSCQEAARQLGVSSLREVAFAGLDAALDRLSDSVVRARTRHVVTEIERVRQTVALLRAGRLAEVGPLFNASHASMRDDFEITVPAIDGLVLIAQQAIGTAGGARMTGGGFGGCVVAVVPEARVDAVRAAIDRQYRAPSGESAMIWVCRASAGTGTLPS
jgi:galactokinase